MKLFILIATLLSATAALSASYRQMYIINRTEQNQGAGTPNSCVLSLAEYDLKYAIEWRVFDSNPLWMIDAPKAGHRLLASNGTDCISTTCFTHGERNPNFHIGKAKASQYIDNYGQIQSFKANVPYYFAARQYIDENNNGVWDDGEFVRDWSPATTVTGSNDYNHRCTFNTYPAQ